VILRPVLIVGLRTAVYASQCIFPNALVSFRALPLLALPTVSLGRTHRRRAAGRIVVRARLRSRQRGAPTGSAWSGGGSNTDGPVTPRPPFKKYKTQTRTHLHTGRSGPIILSEKNQHLEISNVNKDNMSESKQKKA